MESFELGSLIRPAPVGTPVQGGPEERREQRMRFQRLRFEFGMELAAEIPGMIRQFADFDVHAIGSLAGKPQAMRCQHAFKLAIEFVAMAMALADLRSAVGLLRRRLSSARRHG